MMNYELKSKRIGLVFGGGGAKGAYHAGCIKALEKNGIRNFEVICGTSIGAITAAAVSTNRTKELIKFWENISFKKMFQPSIRGFLILPITLYANILGYLSKPKNFLSYLAKSVLFFITPISLFLFGNYFQSNEIISFILYACSILSFLFLSTLSFYGFAGEYLFYKSRKILSKIYESSNLGKSDKLEKAIIEILGNELGYIKFSCPTFVTLAKRHCWFDPDRPSFYSDEMSAFFHDIHKPKPLPGYLPYYFEISSLNKSEIISRIIGSASIPYLMPTYDKNEERFIDGGFVDNLPVYKAMEFNCDCLITINLSENFSIKKIEDWMPRMRRAFYISKLSLKEQHMLYINWLKKKLNVEEIDGNNRFWYRNKLPQTQTNEIVKEEKNESSPKIILVQPSKKLGGWIRGTLNFNRMKARYLINLGERDMNNALMQHC